MGGILSCFSTLVVAMPTTPNRCTTLFAQNGESTQLIQQSLDQCEKGKAVYLESNNNQHFFISGPISIPSERALVIQ